LLYARDHYLLSRKVRRIRAVKKTVLAFALIFSATFSLLLLAVEFQSAILVKGNIVPLSTVDITFPQNDKTYYSTNLTVCYHADYHGYYRLLVYNLDRKGNVTILNDEQGPAEFDGNFTLSDLNAGSHNLIIYSESGTWFSGADQVYFNIFDSPSECKISIHSPQNGTYYSEPVLLNFTKTGHFTWSYSYSYVIDEQSVQSATPVENVYDVPVETTVNDPDFAAICGWGYLPNLAEGAHNLTLYSVDADSVIFDIETIYFNIGEPFPTMLVVASASLVAVGIGLLIYLKRKKETRVATSRSEKIRLEVVVQCHSQ